MIFYDFSVNLAEDVEKVKSAHKGKYRLEYDWKKYKIL